MALGLDHLAVLGMSFGHIQLNPGGCVAWATDSVAGAYLHLWPTGLLRHHSGVLYRLVSSGSDWASDWWAGWPVAPVSGVDALTLPA